VAHMTSAYWDKSRVKVSMALGRLYRRADLTQLLAKSLVREFGAEFGTGATEKGDDTRQGNRGTSM
jgi:hypothetical protein